MILKDRKLTYFKDEKESLSGVPPRGVINFDLVSVTGVTVTNVEPKIFK
jgi:hypothetical protein